MLSHTTKIFLKLIPVAAVALSLSLMGKAFADEPADILVAVSSEQQLNTIINWNRKMQATLSTKMENNLKLEMQALTINLPDQPVYANQLIDSTTRDVVLIKADQNGAGITALSTTPVVVIIDRKELCLLNL